MFPEVRRGLFITNGVTVLLQRLVGQGRAKELLLTGLPIDAPRALAIGLANHVLAPDVLLPQCVAMGVAIAENAPLSVERTKRIVHETADRDLEFALAKEVEYAIDCFREGAHEEGARAFFDKRPPHFVRKDAGTP